VKLAEKFEQRVTILFSILIHVNYIQIDNWHNVLRDTLKNKVQSIVATTNYQYLFILDPKDTTENDASLRASIFKVHGLKFEYIQMQRRGEIFGCPSSVPDYTCDRVSQKICVTQTRFEKSEWALEILTVCSLLQKEVTFQILCTVYYNILWQNKF
jgi:hypothetical protein